MFANSCASLRIERCRQLIERLASGYRNEALCFAESMVKIVPSIECWRTCAYPSIVAAKIEMLIDLLLLLKLE